MRAKDATYFMPSVNIKKAWGNKSSKEKCQTELKLSLRRESAFTLKFSIRCFIYDKSTGENLINEKDFPFFASLPEIEKCPFTPYFKEMYEALQDKEIHIGTPMQEEIIRDAYANGEITSLWNESEHKEYLSELDMKIIDFSDNTHYDYGDGYLDNDVLPLDKAQKITWLIDQPEKNLSK